MNSFYSVSSKYVINIDRTNVQGGIMEGFKILSPKVEEFVLVVSISCAKPTGVEENIKYHGIHKARKFFTTMRDREWNHEYKVEYDRARALLKWAITCNARLADLQYTSDRKLKFSFGFPSTNELMEFYQSLSQNVDGATMKP